MARPNARTVVKWRELAAEGKLYAEIQRKYPEHTVDQVRHYCMGHCGKDIGGPIATVDRWNGSNVWLRGSRSPHSKLSEADAKRVLKFRRKKGTEWARELDVSASTIYMLRRGETWKHLPRL